MPYTIIVCDDNSLYGSHKRKIMQKEKLFNKLLFLAPSCYNGYDMSKCTVVLRYLLPISKEFKMETLKLSDEKYEDYLIYALPVDTCLTKEWGDIALNLTFIMLEKEDSGEIVQRVRKTGNHILTVTQLPSWDSIVPDSALAELDQRIIQQDIQIKMLAELANSLDIKQVDNLVYNSTDETLQLSSKGVGVGNKVSVRDILDDGIPVVDLNSGVGDNFNPDNNDSDNCDCGCEYNAIEF